MALLPPPVSGEAFWHSQLRQDATMAIQDANKIHQKIERLKEEAGSLIVQTLRGITRRDIGAVGITVEGITQTDGEIILNPRLLEIFENIVALENRYNRSANILGSIDAEERQKRYLDDPTARLRLILGKFSTELAVEQLPRDIFAAFAVVIANRRIPEKVRALLGPLKSIQKEHSMLLQTLSPISLVFPTFLQHYDEGFLMKKSVSRNMFLPLLSLFIDEVTTLTTNNRYILTENKHFVTLDAIGRVDVRKLQIALWGEVMQNKKFNSGKQGIVALHSKLAQETTKLNAKIWEDLRELNEGPEGVLFTEKPWQELLIKAIDILSKIENLQEEIEKLFPPPNQTPSDISPHSFTSFQNVDKKLFHHSLIGIMSWINNYFFQTLDPIREGLKRKQTQAKTMLDELTKINLKPEIEQQVQKSAIDELLDTLDLEETVTIEAVQSLKTQLNKMVTTLVADFDIEALSSKSAAINENLDEMIYDDLVEKQEEWKLIGEIATNVQTTYNASKAKAGALFSGLMTKFLYNDTLTFLQTELSKASAVEILQYDLEKAVPELPNLLLLEPILRTHKDTIKLYDPFERTKISYQKKVADIKDIQIEIKKLEVAHNLNGLAKMLTAANSLVDQINDIVIKQNEVWNQLIGSYKSFFNILPFDEQLNKKKAIKDTDLKTWFEEAERARKGADIFPLFRDKDIQNIVDKLSGVDNNLKKALESTLQIPGDRPSTFGNPSSEAIRESLNYLGGIQAVERGDENRRRVLLFAYLVTQHLSLKKWQDETIDVKGLAPWYRLMGIESADRYQYDYFRQYFVESFEEGDITSDIVNDFEAVEESDATEKEGGNFKTFQNHIKTLNEIWSTYKTATELKRHEWLRQYEGMAHQTLAGLLMWTEIFNVWKDTMAEFSVFPMSQQQLLLSELQGELKKSNPLSFHPEWKYDVTVVDFPLEKNGYNLELYLVNQQWKQWMRTLGKRYLKQGIQWQEDVFFSAMGEIAEFIQDNNTKPVVEEVGPQQNYTAQAFSINRWRDQAIPQIFNDRYKEDIPWQGTETRQKHGEYLQILEKDLIVDRLLWLFQSEDPKFEKDDNREIYTAHEYLKYHIGELGTTTSLMRTQSENFTEFDTAMFVFYPILAQRFAENLQMTFYNVETDIIRKFVAEIPGVTTQSVLTMWFEEMQFQHVLVELRTIIMKTLLNTSAKVTERRINMIRDAQEKHPIQWNDRVPFFIDEDIIKGGTLKNKGSQKLQQMFGMVGQSIIENIENVLKPVITKLIQSNSLLLHGMVGLQTDKTQEMWKKYILSFIRQALRYPIFFYMGELYPIYELGTWLKTFRSENFPEKTLELNSFVNNLSTLRTVWYYLADFNFTIAELAAQKATQENKLPWEGLQDILQETLSKKTNGYSIQTLLIALQEHFLLMRYLTSDVFFGPFETSISNAIQTGLRTLAEVMPPTFLETNKNDNYLKLAVLNSYYGVQITAVMQRYKIYSKTIYHAIFEWNLNHENPLNFSLSTAQNERLRRALLVQDLRTRSIGSGVTSRFIIPESETNKPLKEIKKFETRDSYLEHYFDLFAQRSERSTLDDAIILNYLSSSPPPPDITVKMTSDAYVVKNHGSGNCLFFSILQALTDETENEDPKNYQAYSMTIRGKVYGQFLSHIFWGEPLDTLSGQTFKSDITLSDTYQNNFTLDYLNQVKFNNWGIKLDDRLLGMKDAVIDLIRDNFAEWIRSMAVQAGIKDMKLISQVNTENEFDMWKRQLWKIFYKLTNEQNFYVDGTILAPLVKYLIERDVIRMSETQSEVSVNNLSLSPDESVREQSFLKQFPKKFFENRREAKRQDLQQYIVLKWRTNHFEWFGKNPLYVNENDPSKRSELTPFLSDNVGAILNVFETWQPFSATKSSPVVQSQTIFNLNTDMIYPIDNNGDDDNDDGGGDDNNDDNNDNNGGNDDNNDNNDDNNDNDGGNDDNNDDNNDNNGEQELDGWLNW